MLTVDFGNLVDLVEGGLTQRVNSSVLNRSILATYVQPMDIGMPYPCAHVQFMPQKNVRP